VGRRWGCLVRAALIVIAAALVAYFLLGEKTVRRLAYGYFCEILDQSEVMRQITGMGPSSCRLEYMLLRVDELQDKLEGQAAGLTGEIAALPAFQAELEKMGASVATASPEEEDLRARLGNLLWYRSKIDQLKELERRLSWAIPLARLGEIIEEEQLVADLAKQVEIELRELELADSLTPEPSDTLFDQIVTPESQTETVTAAGTTTPTATRTPSPTPKVR